MELTIGTRIIHINHGAGVIIHVWPDTGLTVQFDKGDVFRGDNGFVIVSPDCCTLETPPYPTRELQPYQDRS